MLVAVFATRIRAVTAYTSRPPASPILFRRFSSPYSRAANVRRPALFRFDGTCVSVQVVQAADCAPQVVFKTRSVANAATAFVIQMKGRCVTLALDHNRA
jgi:hypothetical protein